MSQSAYARLDPRAMDPAAVVAPPRRLATLPFDEPVEFIPPKARPARRRRRARFLPAILGLAAVSAAGWAMVIRPPDEASPVRAAADAPPPAPRAPVRTHAWLFEAAPALREAASGFGRDAPLAASFRRAPAPVQVASADAPVAAPDGTAPVRTLAAAPVRLAAVEPAKGAILAALPAAAPVTIPLPVPRPAEFSRAPAAPAQRVAAHRALPRTRDVFRAAMAEEPSFFERLFGTGRAEPSRQEAPRQALAYADPGALPEAAPRPRLSPAPEAISSAGTAVYDISAGRVTLPSGEVLEAHSGLGAMMDDPRYVHVRMRGSTPPATYDLRERESLFHGVRAIRLTPVGGSGAIHGRDGLLAHTYMLRQPGASNGCVSFRDYDRFLQAYLRGEVRRLVVVAGGGIFGSRRFGSAERTGGGA